MARFTSLVLGAAVFAFASALPANTPRDIPIYDHAKKQYDVPNADRAQAVVDAFKTSWEGYYKYAFPNDELKPVTNGFSNSR